MRHITEAYATSLEGNPEMVKNNPARLKLFFGWEEGSETPYGALFLNLDVPNRVLELNEKDPEYRAAILAALGAYGQKRPSHLPGRMPESRRADHVAGAAGSAPAPAKRSVSSSGGVACHSYGTGFSRRRSAMRKRGFLQLALMQRLHSMK